MNYLIYALETYRGLSSGETDIKYHFYCLDSKSFRKLSKNNARAIFVESASGSSGHGKAIDKAFEFFVPEAINIISDTDIAIVHQKWDLELVNIFWNTNISILGTQYEGTGGFSSGSSKLQSYKNKPSATWIAFGFRTSVYGLSACPNKESTIRITNQDLSSIYGLPIGYEVLRDTGWQIPGFIAKHKLEFKLLEIVKPTSAKSQVLTGLNPYHDEFHLNGAPFLVHQRGSMTHLFRRDTLSKDFYKAVDSYLGINGWNPSRSLIDFFHSIQKVLKRVARRFVKSARKKNIFNFIVICAKK